MIQLVYGLKAMILHVNPHQITRFFLLLVLAALASAENQPTLPPELTLAEALNIALSNSTILRTAQANLDEASGRYRQLRSTLLPQLGINGRQSIQTINLIGLGIDIPGATTGRIGPFGSMDARAYLTQDVINLANVRAEESFRWRRESSRFLSYDAREVVTLNVVAAYLQALTAKESRDTLTAQTKLAEDLYRIARDRVTHGVAAELDAIRAMQLVNALEQRRQEAEQGYVAAKLSLANILQAHVTENFEVSDNAAYGSVSVLERQAAINTALASRADYRSAAAEVRAAELRVRSVKASRLPTLSALFDDGQSGISPVNNVNVYRIQGSISFPIFTGGRISGEIVEAEGAVRAAVAARDANRSQIETDVLTAISGVEWGLKEVATSAGNVKLSRQEVDLTRQRFTQGIADNTEVVNAQNRLEQADAAQVRARYTLGLARANLARATGVAEKAYRK